MWDVKACRGCLATDCRLEKISDTYRRILPSLTALEIAEGDGYPQYLCMECHAQVKKALAFRRKCRRANFVLKQIMTAKKQVSYSDITNVNRKKSNLTSSLITTTASTNEIKPEDCLEIQEQEETKLIEDNKEEEDNYLEEIDREENEAEDNYEDLPNVDLDDVFKDLNDEQAEEDSEVSEIEEVKVEPPRKKKNPCRNKILTIHKALSNTVIKYVSEEQQVNNFKARMQMEPFKSAFFKCSLCLTIYNELPALLSHTKVHKKIANGHCCNVCKWCFESEEELVCHKSYNHWYEYICGLCNETHYAIDDQIKCYNKKKKDKIAPKPKVEYLSSLEMTPLAQEEMPSTLICWPGCKYQCEICNIGFILKSTFEAHTEKHKATNNKYTCDICGTHHFDKKWMVRHNNWYHSYSYTCKHCKQVFMNRFLAQHHVVYVCTRNQEHPKSTFTKCTFCEKTCVDSKMQLHLYYVHYGEKYTHHCIICGLSFDSQHKLVNHQVNEHNYIRVGDIRLGDARYACLQCNVRFVCSGALSVHISKSGHCPVNGVEQTCCLCKVTFGSEDELALHTETCRLIEYPHKCIYCDEMMKDAVVYQRHYKRKHVGEQAIVGSSLHLKDNVLCSLCGKTMHKSWLKRHMQQHTEKAEEMPYSCEYCIAKKVQLASALQYAIHMLANHVTRPYHCALCPAKFKNRCECRVHILKTHAPVRPYTCGVCARTFSHADYLNDHSLKAHNINVKKTNKNIFLSKNMQGKVFVYPDMKLDVSLIGKDIIDLIDVYICDYMDENERILQDYTDYLIFEYLEQPEKETARTVNRPKRVRSLESGPKKKRIRRRKDQQTYDNIEVKIEENIAPDYTEDVETKVYANSINNMSKVGNMVLDERGTQYEVIKDENGEEFVQIGGVLYKLESSD